MAKTRLSEKERPLLTSAISKLDPEVFSHPVWIRFGKQGVSSPLAPINELICTAKRLENDDPSGACQALLICAVCQNYADWQDNALRTVLQALALAERNNLADEKRWAAWGASAICFQQENYEQSAMYLEYLRAGLKEQNEWILADFIEVLKQSMRGLGSASTREGFGLSNDGRSSRDLLSITFDWLRHWGISQAQGANSELDSSRSVAFANRAEEMAYPSVLSQPRRGAWSTLLRVIRGELKLEWIERDQRRTSSGFTLLHSPLSSTTSSWPGQTTEPWFADDSSQQPCQPASHVLSDVVKPEKNSHGVAGHHWAMSAVVQMLGSFSITIQDNPVKLPASRGLSLLKYLLLHHKQDTAREVLMDIFWPDADPEASRNNLNVAMHNLRRALRSVTGDAVIRFEDGAYGLANNLHIWLDVEEFEQYIKEGLRLEAQNQPATAATKYEMAVGLYRGDFLADSPYEAWTIPDRERLLVAYLETLVRVSQIYFSQEHYAACIAQCHLILARDPCREDAHYRLMQCYSRLGQGPLALRQYQIFAEALRLELDVDPAPETTQLYEHIRHRQPV